MDLEKLKRVVHREFTRSPLKTGFLVVVCLVAAYVLIPLCLPKDKEGGVAPSPSLSSAAPAADPNPTEPVLDWKQSLRRRRADPFSQSASLGHPQRNPFQLEVAPAEAAAAREEEPKSAPRQWEGKPEEHFVLSATILGPRMRVAMINGRRYREQDLVPWQEPVDRREEGFMFRVVRIASDHVTLEQGGRLFRLELTPRADYGISIVSRAGD